MILLWKLGMHDAFFLSAGFWTELHLLHLFGLQLIALHIEVLTLDLFGTLHDFPCIFV